MALSSTWESPSGWSSQSISFLSYNQNQLTWTSFVWSPWELDAFFHSLIYFSKQDIAPKPTLDLNALPALASLMLGLQMHSTPSIWGIIELRIVLETGLSLFAASLKFSANVHLILPWACIISKYCFQAGLINTFLFVSNHHFNSQLKLALKSTIGQEAMGGTWQMAQWLAVKPAPTKDPSLIPCTHLGQLKT